METRKFYAVVIYDNTCNVIGRESGIYGKGDYSWITESLNGGNGSDFCTTKDEAENVKTDFERVIEERNLEWASVFILEIEL